MLGDAEGVVAACFLEVLGDVEGVVAVASVEVLDDDESVVATTGGVAMSFNALGRLRRSRRSARACLV